MAKGMYKAPEIVLDLDAIRNSGVLDKLAQELNKDANNSFIELTLLEETDNDFNKMKGGNQLLKEIKSKLQPNQDVLKSTFLPSVEPSIQEFVDNNPETAFKTLYNDYTYNSDIPTSEKLKLRNSMSYARKKLEEKGKTESDVLSDNPAIKTLNTVSKILSIPTNALAKGFTSLSGGDASKIKLWGGLGWEESLRQMDMNPYQESILEKVRDNIPLTPDEEQQNKEFTKKHAGWGTLLNIVADPSNLLAGAGLVAKAGKATKLAKGLDIASDVAGLNALGLVGKAKQAVKLAKTPLSEIEDVARTQILNAERMIKEAIPAQAVMTTSKLQSPLKLADTENIAKIENQIKAVTGQKLSRAQRIAQTKEAKRLLQMPKGQKVKYTKEGGIVVPEKVLQSFEETVKTFDTPTRSILKNLENLRSEKNLDLNKVNKALDSAENVLRKNKNDKLANELNTARQKYTQYVSDIESAKKSKTVQATGKAFEKIGGIVKGVQEKTGIRKMFISDVPTESAKKVTDDVRRFESSLKEKVVKMQETATKQLMPKLIKNQNVVDYLKNNKDITLNHIVADMLENEKEAIKKYGVTPDDIYGFRKILDDMIIEEVKYVGSKVKPLTSDKRMLTIWNDRADKLKYLLKENPYHKDIPIIEAELRNVLDSTNKRTWINDDATDNITYLLHQFTPEAKEIWLKLDQKSRGILKKRLVNLSINQVNDLNKSGELKNIILENAVKELNAGKINQKEYESMVEFANVLDNFKDINLFDTDISKLIGVRGARMTRLITQGKFNDEIAQFAEETPVYKEGIKYIRPNVPMGNELADKYFHPEIAKTIEKMYEYTKTDSALNKFVNIANDINNFWRSTTLGLYPSTVARNMLGNILNSLLGVKSAPQYSSSVKDAILNLYGKQSYRIVTESGKMYELNDLKKIADAAGMFSTGIKQNDTVAAEIAKRGGGLVNSIGAGINEVNKIINKLPTSTMNNLAESTSKYALFITKIKEGLPVEDAIKETYKYLFDYGDLTDKEKFIKNTFIPFYTFIRKNLPLQIAHLTSLPTRTMLKLQYDINAPRAGEKQKDERSQTNWLAGAAKLKVGDRDLDIQSYLMLEGLLPQFDIMRIAKLSMGGKQFVDDIIKDMSPFIKTPIETVTNYSFKTKKPLQYAKGQTSEFLGLKLSPKLKNFLDIWRVLSMADKAGLSLGNEIRTRPDVDMNKFLISYLAGSTIDFDPRFSRISSGRDYKQELTSELNDFKSYNAKVRNAIFNGKKLSPVDQERILNRAKSIFWIINKGYEDAKINSKERGQYMNQLVNGLLV